VDLPGSIRISQSQEDALPPKMTKIEEAPGPPEVDPTSDPVLTTPIPHYKATLVVLRDM
jgi:hypothetical protein